MARIRSIHPDACKSRKLARSTGDAERTYFRLQIHCDDEGRVEDEPDVLSALLFQANPEFDEGVVDGWLTELDAVGLILRYQVGGRRLIQVVGWRQRPNRPTPSTLPAATDSNSVRTHEQLSEDSVSTHCRREGVVVAVAVAVAAGESEGTADLLAAATTIVEQRRDTFTQSRRKDNPSAWLARARQGIRDELTAIVPAPDTPEAWAELIAPSGPVDQRSAAAAALAQRGMAQLHGDVCEYCHGSRFIHTDADTVIDCPHCK